MAKVTIRQKPFHLKKAGKRDVRSQFAALPYRVKDGSVQILLITSRGSGRWILPKGWPMHGATPAESAAIEAYEEAGIKGKASDRTLGFYVYQKRYDRETYPVVVAVFPVKVQKLLKEWPEHGQRNRKWVSQSKAAKLLAEPELRQIVKHFDPRTL